jgi:hypothetical protein
MCRHSRVNGRDVGGGNQGCGGLVGENHDLFSFIESVIELNSYPLLLSKDLTKCLNLVKVANQPDPPPFESRNANALANSLLEC